MRNAAIILLCICVPIFMYGYFQGEESVEDTIIPVEEVLPYSNTFRHYAPQIGWNWELLAAVAYHESRFNAQAHSHSGACGVMQLMPKTGHRFGLNDSTIWVPEENIRAGVEYIRFLQHKWDFIGNQEEQTKFVLASYNTGSGVIFVARRKARNNGANPYVWSDVAPYVKSAATRHYVLHVLKTADKYRDDFTERKTDSL